MIYLRKPVKQLTEDVDNIDKDTQDIVDSDLQKKKAQLLQQKANKKAQFDREMQRIDDQILQLYNQQANKNKNVQQTQQTNQPQQAQQNESIKIKKINKLFEGRNTKIELLNTAITNVFNNIETSYALSNIEINRLSRKINDTINNNKNNKNNKNLLSVVKFEIKKYLLNHNRISLSQSEINNLLDLLENELQKREYNVFSYIFNSNIDSITINMDNNINIDEFEADLADLDFNIDEDLENNQLILTNVDEYNIKQLKRLLKKYNLLKNNYDIFFN